MKREEIELLVQMVQESTEDNAVQITPLWPLLKRGVKNPQTLRSFESDLHDVFGRKATDPMLWHLVTLDEDRLRSVLLEYLADLRERGLKDATINRRGATLRRVFRVAHQNGLRRDNASNLLAPFTSKRSSLCGPNKQVIDRKAIDKVLSAPEQGSLLGSRDRAIMLSIARGGLSRVQICALNIGDFDQEAGTLLVLPLHQPRHLPERLHRIHQFLHAPPALPVPEDDMHEEAQLCAQSNLARGKATYRWQLPQEVVAALEEYLGYLSQSGFVMDADFPLFPTLDRRHVKDASRNQRLTEDGVYVIVQRYAKSVGHPNVNTRTLQRAAEAASTLR